MDNKDFDLLFDEKVKTNIKDSFSHINMSMDLKAKIKDHAIKNRSFKDKLNYLLNYEIEIPVGRLGVIAAILAIIPTSFTIYEGRKIMSNNVVSAKEYAIKENGDFNK